MNKFLVIQNGKITSERVSLEIVDGEIQDDGTYGTVGQVFISGSWVDDPVEIAERDKQNRIAELKALIDNKNYLGDSVTVERAELRTLLGL